MEKSELIQLAKSHFKGLEDTETDDFNFSLESAIYYYCCHYHSGQFSDLYSILSTSDYNPGRLETFESWKESDLIGADIYSLFELSILN